MSTLHRQPKLGELEPLPPRSLPYGQFFSSALGKLHGSPAYPIVVYGHDALDTAAFIAEASTLCSLAVGSLELLEQAVAAESTIGIFAMSRPNRPGEAAKALARYGALNSGPAVKLYGAWTHDPQLAIAHALAAGANGLVLPDSDAQEMFRYIFAILQAIGEDKPLAATNDAMLQHLRVAFAESPFWTMADAEPPSTY